MFYQCSQLTQLDLSNWDIGSVTDMTSMFKLTKIKHLKLFKNYNNPSIPDMFFDNNSLTKIDMRYLSVETITSLLLELERINSKGNYLTIHEDAPSTDRWKPVLLKQMQVVLPKPLRRIDNIKDSLFYNKDTESYNLIQNIEEIALTGLEDAWTLSNNIFSLPLSLPNVYYNNNLGNIKSSSLSSVTSFNNNKGIMFKDNTIQIYDDSFSTVDEFKEYFQDNPIYVQYQLQDAITHEVIIEDRTINHVVSFNLNDSVPSKNALIESNVERIDVSGVSPNSTYTLQFHSEYGGTFELRLGSLELTINAIEGFNAREITTSNSVGDSKLLLFNQGVSISNVMLVEGRHLEELPYFEGLLSVGKTFSDGQQKVVIESSIDATTYNAEDEILYPSKLGTQNDVRIEGQTLVNSCIERKTTTLNDKIEVEGAEVTLENLALGSKLDFYIEGNSLKNEILTPIYSINASVEVQLDGDNVFLVPQELPDQCTLVASIEGHTELKGGKLVSLYENGFITFMCANSDYLWNNSCPWK
jgi:surface protein